MPDTTSGLPRLQPRGRAPGAGGVQVHLHARDDHPGRARCSWRSTTSPIRTNEKTRESRLFPSMWAYVRRNGVVDLPRLRAVRAAARVHDRRRASWRLPRRSSGAASSTSSFEGEGAGHVQSLILGAVLLFIAACSSPRSAWWATSSPAAARAPAAHPRARAPRGAAAGRGALALRARRAPCRARSRPRAPTPAPPPARPRASRARRCGCEQTHAAEAVPTGNTYDKYGSTNPVVRRLMAGFQGTLDELWKQAAPQSILDVGCGEGVLTHEWAERAGRAAGSWASTSTTRSSRPSGRSAGATNLEYRVEEATALSFADGRVRHGHRDRGARARARARAHGGRDGARGRALAARVGAARAALARAQHGARRVLEAARQHARAT